MILRCRRCRLISTTTILALRYFRSYAIVHPSLLSRKSTPARRASSSATPSLLLPFPTSPASTLFAAPRSRRSFGTSLSGERTPMIGPVPKPAAPLVDAEGRELSKPTKRKVAIVVGYVGSSFHGWQQSTDKAVRTVEGVLETALWKAGAIADSNYGDLNKIGWGRTSRTDKGVHASKTVAAAKLLLPQETFSEKGLSQYGKDKLNEHLPGDVRCFSIAKVPKSFRGRDECTLREYSYYLPRQLLRSDEELSKFRNLLGLFVGTQSFHNFASNKGRQLKEVRRRVQASIDLKKASGGVSSGAGGDSKLSPCTGAAENGGENFSENVDGGGFVESGGSEGKKRHRSKDDWRTYRHKKMSSAKQREEDEWYRKPSAGGTEKDGLGQAGSSEEALSGGVGGGEVGVMDSNAITASGDTGKTAGAAAEARANCDDAGDGNGDEGCGGENVEGGDEEDYDVEKSECSAAAADKGDDGPEKVLLLRELRTSIYRCEALEEIVTHRREGQTEPDEFVRVDIRGKAFVYNQIRLMIGGTLGEARGDLMPGFVEAALKTPYRLRVPLAPAEGLVLESQAFTRHANALVLDPRELGNIGGTLAVWSGGNSASSTKDNDRGGNNNYNNNMQTSGRLQSLLTLEQLEEAERWRDDYIVPAVAEAWAARDAAGMFLMAMEKFFAGQQQEEHLLKAIRDNLSEISENDRLAEEKHNKFREIARKSGSTRCKDLLPKNIATQIVCKFRMLPGNKVNAVQRGVVKHMEQGDLQPLAEKDEVLAFIEKIGVDQVALDGGFVAPDIDTPSSATLKPSSV